MHDITTLIVCFRFLLHRRNKRTLKRLLRRERNAVSMQSQQRLLRARTDPTLLELQLRASWNRDWFRRSQCTGNSSHGSSHILQDRLVVLDQQSSARYLTRLWCNNPSHQRRFGMRRSQLSHGTSQGSLLHRLLSSVGR